MAIIGTVFWFGLLVLSCFVPLYLTYRNLRSSREHSRDDSKKKLELITIVFGFFLTWFLLAVSDVTCRDWFEVLSNSQRHTPINTQAAPTVLTLFLISLIAYLLLTYRPLDKFSPLGLVLSLSGLYLGMFLALLWIIQMSGGIDTDRMYWWIEQIYLNLLALNFIIIYLKTLIRTVREWSAQNNIRKTYSRPWLNHLQSLLSIGYCLPFWALLALVPFLGVVVMFLTLFGQEPDSVIKAWTETSDWQLSQKLSPPNVYYDEHYLCTVGAYGHPKLVKPLRFGERHHHRVVVNRQLCIANAFEQILEERFPRGHATLRKFYDLYGYPIARHIKTAWQADVIYLLMKPLEWFFLTVIYLCDTKPENRIASQYLPSRSVR